MPNPNNLAQLAGAYRLRPGRRPGIAGERPLLEGDRLARLLRGSPADRAPQACAAVFTLCAHAHRRCAEAAVAAAQGLPRPGDAPLLAYETARDHLRAIALDWPARAGVAPDLSWLRDAPLPIGGPPMADAAAARDVLRAVGEWLAKQVLQADPQQWLVRCRAPEELLAWCEERAARVQPAQCLALWHPVAQATWIGCEPLRMLPSDPEVLQGQLRNLAAALCASPRFAQLPQWRERARENGPWTRQRHTDAALPSTAWMRLAARWFELVELAAMDHEQPLLHDGALPLAPGEAIAWCEMARGLLFHWVRVAGDGTIADYRVLAPTEWNFHPQGALARALEGLARGDAATAGLLAAAFDPCVPCSIESA